MEVTAEDAEAAARGPLTERAADAVDRSVWPHATWLASGAPLPPVRALVPWVRARAGRRGATTPWQAHLACQRHGGSGHRACSRRTAAARRRPG